MDPRILLLDDSTASVDSETEHLIQEALQELMRGRTTFVIAQRLSTVERADQIVVLDRGEIVERGTHRQLLAAHGPYAHIHRLQQRDRRDQALLQGHERPPDFVSDAVPVASPAAGGGL